MKAPHEIVILSRVEWPQCMFCVHLDFSPYDPGNWPSEQIPMILRCPIQRWDSQYILSLDDFRRILLRAHTCSDWLPADLDELRVCLKRREQNVEG